MILWWITALLHWFHTEVYLWPFGYKISLYNITSSLYPSRHLCERLSFPEIQSSQEWDRRTDNPQRHKKINMSFISVTSWSGSYKFRCHFSEWILKQCKLSNLICPFPEHKFYKGRKCLKCKPSHHYNFKLLSKITLERFWDLRLSRSVVCVWGKMF